MEHSSIKEYDNYYKVVWVGKMYGAPCYQSVCVVKNLFYGRGFKTIPTVPHSKLFCFRYLKDAVNYVGTDSNLKIFRCKVENPTRVNPVKNWKEIETYWKLRKAHKSTKHIERADIVGSYAADSITLLEEVKNVQSPT